jgi:hypothetical protein
VLAGSVVAIVAGGLLRSALLLLIGICLCGAVLLLYFHRHLRSWPPFDGAGRHTPGSMAEEQLHSLKEEIARISRELEERQA